LHEYHMSHPYVTPTPYLRIHRRCSCITSHNRVDIGRVPLYSGGISWGAGVTPSESKRKEKLCPVHWWTLVTTLVQTCV